MLQGRRSLRLRPYNYVILRASCPADTRSTGQRVYPRGSTGRVVLRYGDRVNGGCRRDGDQLNSHRVYSTHNVTVSHQLLRRSFLRGSFYVRLGRWPLGGRFALSECSCFVCVVDQSLSAGYALLCITTSGPLTLQRHRPGRFCPPPQCHEIRAVECIRLLQGVPRGERDRRRQ